MESSHLDKEGDVRMVDISSKKLSQREAKAQAVLSFPKGLLEQLYTRGDMTSPKGAVFQTARIAATMAAKNTEQLIPLCHRLTLDRCQVDMAREGEDTIVVICQVASQAKTGVEMEALTAASVAALTIYDMCKFASHEIEIGELKLLAKSGGKRRVTEEP